MPRQSLLVGLVLALSACLGGSPGAAVLNAAVGVGYVAANRANGECWSSCPYGTACDAETGYCEKLPCGGCAAGEVCEDTPTGERCVVPAAEVELVPEAVAVPGPAPVPPAVRIGTAGLDAGVSVGTDSDAGVP